MKNIKPLLLLGATAIVIASLRATATAGLSETEARAYLKKGAQVVDVRTVEEFESKRLTNVINIPLAAVKTRFPTTFTNKGEVILLHCRTGRRSGIAEQELRELGYTNVFNIGSFEQARKIVSPTSK